MTGISKSKNKIDVAVSAAVFILATALAIVGLYVHEPWFDEAQAWLIARDCSLSELLFTVPHYEGHPPLWHLILKLIGSFGLSGELPMKLAQFITFEAALYLLEFRSPFNTAMKAVLPMSYYFLYQYCVISRPYAMLMCAFFVTALVYKNRFNKPFLYMICLLFMCMCHLYGIAFAGGLVISDILEAVIREKKLSAAIGAIFSDKRRLASYIVLLLCAVLILLQIAPASDAYAANSTYKRDHSYLVYLYMTWFFIPSESIVTSSVRFEQLQSADIMMKGVIVTTVISVIVWTLLIVICWKRKKTVLLLLPYSIAAFIMAYYSSSNHFGLFYIYAVFVLWICWEKEPLKLSEFTVKTNSAVLKKAQYTLAGCIAGFVVIMNGVWNISCYAADIDSAYFPGKAIAKWIKENDYQEGYTWLAGWDTVSDNIYSYNGCVVTTNIYFDKNIFFNMKDGKTYWTHIIPTDEEYEQIVSELKKSDMPDFIFDYGYGAISLCNALDAEYYYRPVYIEFTNRPFKADSDTVAVSIYARDDLPIEKD